MTDTLRVKRRLTGSPGAPAGLANAELAYNEVDHTLYYGEGNSSGNATAIVAIAGQGLASNLLPLQPAATAVSGVNGTWSRSDHVHPATAPTVTPATDNTTKIATTAFVQSAISAVSSGVTNITAGTGLTGGGTGNVTIAVATNGITNALAAQMPTMSLKGNNTGAGANALDLTVAQVMTMLNAATLTSPSFNGTPLAPTAANGTNTTQIATTQFVLATRIDQLQPPNIDVPWGSHKITGLLDPTNPQDAATKNYVDATIQGVQYKPTAQYATAAALPAVTYANGTAGVGATLTATANGALSIDGNAPAVGNIVLIKNQAAAAQNGLYNVTQVGSGTLPFILTRNVDMDSSAEFPGAFVPVEMGTVNSNTLWLSNPSTPVTVGTTTIPFVQLNGATDIIAGNGITISGNVITALGVAGFISVGGSGITIDPTYVGQTSITTLGTITTGTWNGSLITVARGGSGAATFTAGYLKANAANPFTTVATIPNTDITGLGTMSTQNATAVAITGGTIDGITIDGGTF